MKLKNNVLIKKIALEYLNSTDKTAEDVAKKYNITSRSVYKYAAMFRKPKPIYKVIHGGNTPLQQSLQEPQQSNLSKTTSNLVKTPEDYVNDDYGTEYLKYVEKEFNL